MSAAVSMTSLTSEKISLSSLTDLSCKEISDGMKLLQYIIIISLKEK